MLSVKITYKKIEQMLVDLWLISFFTEAYCITVLSQTPYYGLTMFTIVTFMSIIIKLFQCMYNKKILFSYPNLYCFLLIIYFIVNYFVLRLSSFTALLLRLFFFGAFLLNTRKETKEEFQRHIFFFMACMDILSVYGIYQFIGTNFFSLPFVNPWWEGHMIAGYNWKGMHYFLGSFVDRANAVFREASFFSQFLAINLLLRVSYILNRKKRRFDIFFLIVNFMAFIMTFSGTGIVILLGTAIIYVLLIEKKEVFFRNILKKLFFCSLGVLAVLITPIGRKVVLMFESRISELFTVGKSGNLRMVVGFVMIFNVWKNNLYALLFGVGLGANDDYIRIFDLAKSLGTERLMNGLFNPALETGIVGLLLWLLFLHSFWKQKDRPLEMTILLCCFIPALMCEDIPTCSYYWILLYLINVSFVDDKGYLYTYF